MTHPLCAARKRRPLSATALGLLLAFGGLQQAQAQSTQEQATAKANRAQAQKATAKTSEKRSTGAASERKAKPEPATAALPTADDEQHHAFSLTHLGEHWCEFRRHVMVAAHPTQAGYAQVSFDKQVVTVKPVLSSTGALRLEDVKGRFLLLQIAFKSMLLDTRTGQRVADECLHDRHHEAKAAAQNQPKAPGLGIGAER